MKPVAKTAALLAAALLTACGGSEKAEPPQAYASGEDSLPSLNSLVTLEDGFQFQQAADEDGTTTTYTYSGLTDGASVAQAYAQALESDYECRVGADSKTGGDADFTAATGQAAALRSAADPAQVYILNIQWDETACSVTPSLAQASDISWQEDAPSAVTLEEAVAHMKGLPPDYLGLTGSMDDYNVIPQDGTVLLDGMPCLCINVYLIQTHQIQNSYLLTLPDLQVYLLDRETGTASALR